jgi:hypothetical protein
MFPSGTHVSSDVPFKPQDPHTMHKRVHILCKLQVPAGVRYEMQAVQSMLACESAATAHTKQNWKLEPLG